jgi:hypothetical protein
VSGIGVGTGCDQLQIQCSERRPIFTGVGMVARSLQGSKGPEKCITLGTILGKKDNELLLLFRNLSEKV